MANVQTFKSGASKMTVEDVKAHVAATLRAMYEKAQSQPTQQVAEPEGVWNLFAVGPIVLVPSAPQWPTPGFDSQQAILVGDTFYIVTIIVLGPEIASFGLPYTIKYSTGNLETWGPAGDYSRALPANVPNVDLASYPPYGLIYDVQEFTGTTTGSFEMNISAQLLRCDGTPAIPYAGFVGWVETLDPEFPINPTTGQPLPMGDTGFVFGEPNWTYNTGLRFMVYAKS